MKTPLFIVTIIILATATSISLADEKGHSHSGHHDKNEQAPATLKLNQGKKWETDLPLRTGMEKIRSLVQKDLNVIHRREASLNIYTRLAQAVDEQVRFLFKNCKLSPQADTQLHIIVAQIMAGSQKMKSAKKQEERRAGAVELIQALEIYPKYFDHPDWKGIVH